MHNNTRLARNMSAAAMLAFAVVAHPSSVFAGDQTCEDLCDNCWIAYQQCDACFGSGCSIGGANCNEHWACTWCSLDHDWTCS